ncbi:MAG: 30S ribosomal protein S8e [Candidatus Diapherotrites archaeon]|nr:30S ribosomal protein S8e [Candidatus Diapherotrites archaeon]
MTQWHLKSKKKSSGGFHASRERSDKKLAWRGGIPALTAISEEQEVDSFRIRGGKTKMASLKVKYANAKEPKTGKYQKCEIITVEENNANTQFPRRNIITLGAIIKVKFDGKEKFAEVTSRPGQDANINAVIVEGIYGLKAKKAEKHAEKAKEGTTETKTEKKAKKIHKNKKKALKEEKKE